MKSQYLLFLIAVVAVIVFFPSFQYGFSQDDFIHLSASRANSAADFLNFFNPFAAFADIFFYRPIATQLYFFFNQSLFGLNPIPFHVIALSLHVANAYLVYRLLKKLLQNFSERYNFVALLSALLYSVSAVHFLSIYYISAFQQISRTFFMLLALLWFMTYQEKGRRMFLYTSLLSFTCALLSKETSVVLPLLLYPLEILRRNAESVQSVLKSTFYKSIPYFSILVAYLALRFIGFQSIFSRGAYDTTVAPFEVIQNIKWYFLWAFGLPEILATYPGLGPVSLKQFINDFPLALPILLLTLAVLISLASVIATSKRPSSRLILCLLSIPIITLLPVFPLHQHRYPQYLDVALFGILPLFLLLLFKKNYFNKMMSFALIASYVLLQVLSLELTQKTHWTTHRAEAADYYYNLLRTQYPSMPAKSVIVFDGGEVPSREISVTLAKHYALKVWYGDQVDRVIYKAIDNEDNLDQIVGQIVIPIAKY